MSGGANCPCCCPRGALGDAHLAMDEATRASLEITASAQGGRKGSLVEAVDRCVTGRARVCWPKTSRRP
jgi:DNA mismatch repair ATPase MutS